MPPFRIGSLAGEPMVSLFGFVVLTFSILCIELLPMVKLYVCPGLIPRPLGFGASRYQSRHREGVFAVFHAARWL
jgi:hypothetical protein